MLACVALGCVVLVGATRSKKRLPPPDTVVFRVTSATGQESRFEGTLAYSASRPEFRHIKGSTPFEMELPSTASLGAILKAERDDVKLGVQLIERGDVPKVRLHGASGRVVVVNFDRHGGLSSVTGM
jgi:hypothetical protein